MAWLALARRQKPQWPCPAAVKRFIEINEDDMCSTAEEAAEAAAADVVIDSQRNEVAAGPVIPFVLPPITSLRRKLSPLPSADNNGGEDDDASDEEREHVSGSSQGIFTFLRGATTVAATTTTITTSTIPESSSILTAAVDTDATPCPPHPSLFTLPRYSATATIAAAASPRRSHY